jgi:type I restriction enzyme S subunit
LHEEKQKQLEQLKKALLQKMFADKAGYPELRFTGFSRHWKQKKLKEVAEINPKTSIPKKFMYVDLESVSGTNLLSTKLIDKDVAPSRAQRTAQKGDIFYQTVRPYQKNNYLFELSDPLHPYVFSTGYAQIRTEQISNTFLFNILQQQSFVNKVLVRCTGTSYPAITGKELEKIKISTPLSLKEQEKIGQLFQHLDHTITLHAKKINQLKSLKQALLQNMFI